MRKILWGILWVTLFMVSCGEPSNFEFKGVEELTLAKLNMGKNKMYAKLRFYNPNNFSMVLKKVDCAILMNQQNFTAIQLDTSFVIGAKSSFLLPTKMEFEMSNLVKNSMDILFNKPIKLTIQGNATLQKGFFTKTLPIAFETTQKLNLGAALTK